MTPDADDARKEAERRYPEAGGDNWGTLADRVAFTQGAAWRAANPVVTSASAIRDWPALWLARRAHRVHVMTDPACLMFHAPRPGSRLDRASRGISCPRCSR